MSDDHDTESDADSTDAASLEGFAADLERARELVPDDAEGVDAVHVGVLREGEIDTTTVQRTSEDGEEEGLRALALLAAHVRSVANQADVEYSTVAADAATLAGQVERIPASTEDVPDE